LIALIFLLLPFIWANQELVGIRLNERISFEEIEPELGSMGERRVLTSAANDLFSENAILGVGIGASPRAFLVAFPDFPVNYAPPHNVILVAALETGLLGGLLYLILLLAPWVSMYVNRKFVFSIELLASSAVLLAVGTVGFFDCYPWCSWSGQLWQHFAWGLWGSFYLQSIATKKK
jgi:O-antigen ligase